MEEEKIKWWGYFHVNGTFKVKRYWEDPRDLEEARESDFVASVHGPWVCDSATEATKMLLASR